MTMMMMISIGKARQINHFCREQRHAHISCVKRGQDRVVGSLSLLGGSWNIVSLEAKGMVWGKRRLLDKLFVFCLLADGRRGEEREGKEREGKQASKCQDTYVYQVYNLLKVLLLPRYYCTYYIINQSAHLSICPSIYPSVYCTCTRGACLLTCLLAGCCRET